LTSKNEEDTNISCDSAVQHEKGDKYLFLDSIILMVFVCYFQAPINTGEEVLQTPIQMSEEVEGPQISQAEPEDADLQEPGTSADGGGAVMRLVNQYRTC
jgi:hypothetical protein